MMTRERELLQQALDALESLFTMKVDADRAKKCGDAVVAIRAHLAAQPAPVPPVTYSSTQATMCAGCGEHKHTPLRIDAMGGYVCLTCIDQKLGSLLGEFGYLEPAPVPLTQCNDNDSPWLICKTCAADGQCERDGIAAPPKAVPLTDTETHAELWKLAVRKGLITVRSELIDPRNHGTRVSWMQGHDKACDISNDAAAHGIAASPAAPAAPVPDALAEAVAKAIYWEWRRDAGYVPWVDGGNSLKQDDARKIARAVVSSAAPVVREPLTEGRITAIANELAFGGGHCNVYELARAIEAAHGITGGKP